MDRTVTTRIDEDLCIGCGACVDVCPLDVLEIRDEKAVIVGEESINCGHCQAACPTGAAKVGALDARASTFETFTFDPTWIPHGQFDSSQMVGLIASRRSCRNYKEKAVPREVLSDLVKIGATAPSGSNCQPWSFTILENRSKVVEFGEKVGEFFRILNRCAESPSLRFISKIALKDQLGAYYRDYYDFIKEGLEQWETGARDRLFHGAPAVIIVSAFDDNTTPTEDALLATQNILLAAHAMGLGTVLVGFAIGAIRMDPRLKRWLKLDKGEIPQAVISIGYPREVYEHIAGRKSIPIRFIK